MTAEVAILNREAVALAADSAVTVSGLEGHKIFTSANKIFALSEQQPVGAMIYGGAMVLGVPWETIIKEYRTQLGDRSFDTLELYAYDFLSFMRTRRDWLFPPASQLLHVSSVIHVFLHGLRLDVDRRVEEEIQQSGSVTVSRIAAILREEIDRREREIEAATRLPDAPADFDARFLKAYRTTVNERVKNVLQNHQISVSAKKRLTNLIVGLFSRHSSAYDGDFESGLVIAGFGSKDVFPKLRAYKVAGIACDLLKVTEEKPVDIDPNGTKAAIRPFAQGEMVFRFMEGVDPYYQAAVELLMRQMAESSAEFALGKVPGLSSKRRKEVLKASEAQVDSLATKASDTLKAARKAYFVDPITQLVSFLPRDELASMAESLVNLTSFKRRVSWDAETVGGPVDVAVISRGDGLVWIKRKHYFDKDLNEAFMMRKQKRIG